MNDKDRMDQFVDYLKGVEVALKLNTTWRAGQAYFNVLYNVRPDISEQIRGTAIDPFHNNSLIPVFLHHVADKW